MIKHQIMGAFPNYPGIFTESEMEYQNFFIKNHGLTQADVGKIFVCKEGLLRPATIEDMQNRPFWDKTIITRVENEDWFSGWSGEHDVLKNAWIKSVPESPVEQLDHN